MVAAAAVMAQHFQLVQLLVQTVVQVVVALLVLQQQKQVVREYLVKAMQVALVEIRLALIIICKLVVVVARELRVAMAAQALRVLGV
jgi:hypothetical protein